MTTVLLATRGELGRWLVLSRRHLILDGHEAFFTHLALQKLLLELQDRIFGLFATGEKSLLRCFEGWSCGRVSGGATKTTAALAQSDLE